MHQDGPKRRDDGIPIRVWSADGKARGASPVSEASLTKIACSFDGKVVVAGDYAGKVIAWDGAKVTAIR